MITQGSIPPFVIVLPGERTGFDMLVALIDTLLPHVEQSMPTGGTPELRAIGGLSRGGGWALRIGLQHPELFGAIGLHSPAVLSPDLFLLPSWATEVPSESVPRLWIDMGSEDTLLPGALDLRARLDKLRWPYTWVQNPGEHTAAYWSGHLAEYLRWYAQAWPSEAPVRVTPLVVVGSCGAGSTHKLTGIAGWVRQTPTSRRRLPVMALYPLNSTRLPGLPLRPRRDSILLIHGGKR